MLNNRDTEIVPCMTACSECDVVVAQRNHLVLYAFAVFFSFLRESEAVKRICTREDVLKPSRFSLCFFTIKAGGKTYIVEMR